MCDVHTYIHTYIHTRTHRRSMWYRPYALRVYNNRMLRKTYVWEVSFCYLWNVHSQSAGAADTLICRRHFTSLHNTRKSKKLKAFGAEQCSLFCLCVYVLLTCVVLLNICGLAVLRTCILWTRFDSRSGNCLFQLTIFIPCLDPCRQVVG
jgi:hypothetical protein